MRAKKRNVVLRERLGARWVKVAKKRTSKRGKFTFKLAAGDTERTRAFKLTAPKAKKVKKSQHTFEVVVELPGATVPPPSTPSASPSATQSPSSTATPTTTTSTNLPTDRPAMQPTATATTSPTSTTLPTSTPTTDPDPVGSASDWAWGYSGGVRWNPCGTITWTYDASAEPYAALADVEQAFQRVAARTGLTFAYSTSPTSAIKVQWDDESDSRLLSDTVGYAEWLAEGVAGKDVDWKIIGATIVLDNAESLRAGHHATGNPSWGQVITHEVTHATGLGHAFGADQLMYPHTVVTWSTIG